MKVKWTQVSSEFSRRYEISFCVHKNTK